MNQTTDVFGIGNPLIDVVINVADTALTALGINKGIMHLVDAARQAEIIQAVTTPVGAAGSALPTGLDESTVLGTPTVFGTPTGFGSPTYSCGGSAPNTIVSLAAFGARVALAGKIGRDEYGGIYRSRLTECGVHDHLADGDGPTGSSVILVTADSERSMNTHLGMCREYSVQDIDTPAVAAAVAGARFLYFTGYMWDTESQKSAVMRALDIAHQSGARVVFDVADPFAVGRNQEVFPKLIRDHVAVSFANEEEARILFATDDIYRCARRYAEICDVFAIKRGARGSLVGTKNGDLFEIPVVPTTVVDSIGAGDMYAAGFLWGMVRDRPPETCGRMASLAASRIVAVRGAQLPTAAARALGEELAAL